MNVVIRVNNEEKDKLIDYYKDKVVENKNPYIVFMAKDEDTVITMYKSGKVMFQGKSADVDASHWKTEFINTDDNLKKELEEDRSLYYNTNAVGSDEVGTGDYFGPIIVTATYVTREDIPYLEELGVRDSKELDDEKIKEIAPIIVKRIKYVTVIVTDEEYNKKYSTIPNLNQIKAILHNKALHQLIEEYKPKYDYIIVDEFAREARYYSYLENNQYAPYIQRGITFIPRAENKNMAVACAAIISRYLYLRELNKLEKKYDITLPKGASKTVDEEGRKIVKKYDDKILYKIAKYNYRNTIKILNVGIS